MKLVGKIILFLWLFSFSAFAQTEQTISLAGENFKDGQYFELNKPLWKYHAGDDGAWANADFDDSGWQNLNPSKVNSDNSWPEWNGSCWFRLHLNVDESLIGKPLSLVLWHLGASEIYLNGQLLQNFGQIKNGSDIEINPQSFPVPFIFSKAGEQTLAVRYSFQTARDLSGGVGAWLARGSFSPGFYAYLQSSFYAQNVYSQRVLMANQYKLFSGILFAFAFLHLLLYVFYRRERANLFYSIFAFTLALGNTFSSLYNFSHSSALSTALLFIGFVGFYSSSFVALDAFLYVAFARRFSKLFWLLCFYLAILLIILGIFSRADFTLYVVIGLILPAIADALRIVIQALRRKQNGAWIIMSGVGIFSIGVIMLILRELRWADWTGNLELFRNFALYLAIPVAVSVYLARNFARVNQNLQTKLIEVEVFSEREIQHEKEKARMLIVEAESERRAKELEEARALQLSMLPRKLPQLPNLEVAAYMKPATEVGGDYYDFHTAADGTLTIAVGDATGHGLKAGSVVTATKSLFNAFAGEKNIPQVFNQTSRSLKAMNLRGLFMAMTMLKIKDNRFSISAAGMPSTLIYRAATGAVEEINLRAVPLGSIAAFKYQEQEFALSANDCLVIMSDGFPEMFNRSGEMLGFDKAIEILPGIAEKSPPEIIEQLVKVSESWADGRPADDDVTFVVLKIGGNLN